MADLNFQHRVRIATSNVSLFYQVYAFLRFLRRSLRQLAIQISRQYGQSLHWGAAIGFFNGYDLLKANLVEGAIVTNGQSLPSLPHPSIIVEADLQQNSRQPWPIFWMHIPNCRLVGTSLAVMDSSKRLLSESVYGEEFCRRSPSFNYIRLPKPLRLPGAWTSTIGDFSLGYYHWLMDAVPRLALMSAFPDETRILTRPMPSYQKEGLKILGLLDKAYETSSSHVLVEHYYFSSPTAMSGCTNPYAVEWLRQQFLPHMSSIATPSRFFVKRVGKTRGILNSQEIEEYLQEQGWVIIDLETLSFVAQIAWFAKANYIIAEHGAALTNLLWCEKECRVLELIPDHCLNGCFEAISLCVKVQYRFEIFLSDSESRFSVPLARLRSILS